MASGDRRGQQRKKGGHYLGITFRAKDYRQGRQRTMVKLSGVRFVRRWMLHVLPPGFVRVRSYGLLANVDGAAGALPGTVGGWRDRRLAAVLCRPDWAFVALASASWRTLRAAPAAATWDALTTVPIGVRHALPDRKKPAPPLLPAALARR